MKHLDLRFAILIPALIIVGILSVHSIWVSSIPLISKVLGTLLVGALILLGEIICFQALWDWREE